MALSSTIVGALICAVCVQSVRINEIGGELDGMPGIKRYQYVDIPKHHVVRRELGNVHADARPTGKFHLPLNVFQKDYNFHFTPATKLFTENLTVAGKAFSTRGYYSGRILGRPDSFAHLHVKQDGQVSGMFWEHPHGDNFFIKPADSGIEGSHIVYQEKRNDSMLPDLAGCGVDDEHPPAVTRNRRSVSATPWIAAENSALGETYCEMALFGDRSFMAEYASSGDPADGINIMVQRFAAAQAVVFSLQDTALNVNTVGGVKLVIKITWVDYYLPQLGAGNTADAIQIDTLTNGQATTRGYLEQFSRADWSLYCLSHAFTYKDFEGTLGLAWTAFPNDRNHNGGICQARYNDGSIGGEVSLNSAWSSSQNFASKQTESQSALVLAHEIGHNVGSPHDATTPASGGDYVMFKFAVPGTAPNNDNFSPASRIAVQAAVTDRGGCFKNVSLGACGNGIVEDGEICDSGGEVSIDPCCSTTRGECTLDGSYTCSPFNETFAGCCTDCLVVTSGPCGVESECKNPGTCAGGSGCDYTGANKPTDTMCEPGVLLATGVKGSMLCSAGECSVSVCTRLGLADCDVITDADWGAGACQLHCKDGDTCKSLSAITGFSPLTVKDPVSGADVVISVGDAILKPPSASCEFLPGEPLSGVCTDDSLCISADSEEDTLTELFAQYNELKDTFLDWVNQERGGLPVWGWLIIVGVLLVSACCGGCYAANKPSITEFKSDFKERRSIRKGKKKRTDAPEGI